MKDTNIQDPHEFAFVDVQSLDKLQHTSCRPAPLYFLLECATPPHIESFGTCGISSAALCKDIGVSRLEIFCHITRCTRRGRGGKLPRVQAPQPATEMRASKASVIHGCLFSITWYPPWMLCRSAATSLTRYLSCRHIFLCFVVSRKHTYHLYLSWML